MKLSLEFKVISPLVVNKNEEACAKLQDAMLEGARLVIKG